MMFRLIFRFRPSGGGTQIGDPLWMEAQGNDAAPRMHEAVRQGGFFYALLTPAITVRSKGSMTVKDNKTGIDRRGLLKVTGTTALLTAVQQAFPTGAFAAGPGPETKSASDAKRDTKILSVDRDGLDRPSPRGCERRHSHGAVRRHGEPG